jgi:outer membrane immunogenic protein
MSKIYSGFPFALLIISFLHTSAVYAAHRQQGPYLGGYFGAGLGNNELTTQVGGITDSSYFSTSTDTHAVHDVGSWTNNPNTAIVGIQAGYDWAVKRMVYGVALDYGAMPLQSSETVAHAPYPDNPDTYSMKTSMSTNWLFTLRGRLGYDTALRWPSFVYITGGMAMTDLEVSNDFLDDSALAGLGQSTHTDNQIGWTAGAGLEINAFENLSLDLEYLYVQIPSVETNTTISNSQAGFGIPVNSLNSSFSSTGDFSANLLKIGFTYHFP